MQQDMMEKFVKYKIFFFIFFIGLVHFNNIHAQQKIITGIIKDRQSDEPIQFASIMFMRSKFGMVTDTAGKFAFILDKWYTNDTLRISNVGYKDVFIPLLHSKDSLSLVIKLDVLPPVNEAVVRVKYNRALWFWKRIMKYKALHNKEHWDNFSYEIYNRLELDIENINKKVEQNKLLKPLNFVFNYIDSTSEDKPFLPAYLTETLSDYYYQKNPHRVREIIKAARTNGIDNESLVKQLGGLYQNINVYNNFIPVFDKQFVSPFNDNGSSYYNFKLLDTQYISKKRFVHLRFTPKRKGQNVFEGDCWIHDTTFSIQKITMRPSVDANINFISGLSMIQEFKPINDSVWFLYKDKFIADISPLGKSKIALKGRKTSTYKNVLLDDSSIIQKLDEAKKAEQVDVLPNSLNLSDSFWQKNRHEELSKSEKTVYILLDTLEKNPVYVGYRDKIEFITRGVKDIGNFRIGPWYYWLSGNVYEGPRMRFDFSTNKDFDKHWYFNTYLAYGTFDNRFKGKAEVRYEFNRTPWSYIRLQYKNDLDNVQMYTDQLGTDNIFATIFRRPNIPFKYQNLEEKKIEYYVETYKGLGFGLLASSKQYNALLNLPGKELFTTASNANPFNTFETTLKIRFAYLERTVSENFSRTSLGSVYPIVQLNLTHGFPGIANSNYTYNKADFSISDFLKIPPYGSIYYNLFAGKIYGTLPYQLLEIHPGNELFYYNKYAFNLMNRFEYLSDQYWGFNIEHNIGNGLFRYIPLTRKWKFRQFWSVKGVSGTLSNENKQLNFVGNYPFKSLDGKFYCEVGTGVDNIFKFFRIDLVWRVSPQQTPLGVAQNNFGIFGSFRVSF